MKKKNTFDVGDIIKFKSIVDHYYLILGVGRKKYLVLCFADGNKYPLDKSDLSLYEKVS